LLTLKGLMLVSVSCRKLNHFDNRSFT